MKKYTADRIIFNAAGYILLTFIALLCLIPFVMIITNSFATESSIMNYGYGIIPREFSLEGYRLSLGDPMQILRAYGVTTFVTIVGTASGLFLMTMTAYVLQRKDFKYRYALSFYFFFTTLFGGGLVPWYILMVRYLHMKNNILALIIPMLLSVWYILILKGFMRSIPEAISESAKIDGAGDFRIFVKIILPLAKPALASIGLFVALNYWNDWYNTMMFISDKKLFSLQYFLYNMLSNAQALAVLSSEMGVSVEQKPIQAARMSMTVIVVGPIIFAYPFAQRYFIKGMTIGSVKG